MNESKDIKDIEALYKTLLENADNKVWKDGDCPEALGDSPHAKGEEPTQDKAEGFTPAIEPSDDKDNAYYMNKISERLKENNQKLEKNGSSQINNSVTMSDKSDNNIFNKLYSTIMEGEDPFEDLGGMEAELGDDGDLDIGGDEGGDEITLTLPRDVAQELCDMLKDQLGDGGDEGDDEMDGMDSDEDFLEDAVKSEPEPKEHSSHTPVGGSNKVAASGYNANTGTAANKGDAKADEEPKELGGHGDREHPDAGKVGAGSNKVHNNNKAPLE